jgi:hypothetical protein
MLERARCISCHKVKLCITFPWHNSETGESGFDHRCPECDEALEEWLDQELTLSRIECEG